MSNATKGSGAKATRRACFTCCKSSLWSRVNRWYTDRAPPLSLSGRTRSTLSTPHISHTSSTCSNHSDTVWSNDKIDDAPLNTMIKEVLIRVRKEDPAWCRWCVDGQALSVWVDASSLATGVSLVYDGAVVEDACWLRPAKDSQHINLAELDTIIKGINSGKRPPCICSLILPVSINGSRTPLPAKPGYKPKPQARCSFNGGLTP